MRYIVTGASGFVGKRLVKELLLRYGGGTNEFIFIARSGSVRIPEGNDRERIKIIQGDITVPDSIKECFRGVDYVFHLAGFIEYGHWDSARYYKSNVDGTENIFRLSAWGGAKKIVYVSTAAIWPPTGSHWIDEETILNEHKTTRYAHSKFKGYQVAQECFERKNQPIVTVCPVAVFGEGAPLIVPLFRQIKLTGFCLIPSSKSKACYAYVGDVANGIIKAFERGEPGRSYIISGKPLSLRELIQKAAEEMGRKVMIKELPQVAGDYLFEASLRILDLTSVALRTSFYYNSELYRFIKGGFLASDRRARSELGYCETDFDRNFKAMVRSFLNGL